MFFAASIAALIVGPLLVQRARQSDRIRDAADGFALVSVCGITLLIILPNALLVGGLSTLPFVAFGLVLPALLHRIGTRTLALTADRALILGVGIHAAIECAALTVADEHLSFAVAAHRVPVGLAVFMLSTKASTGWSYIGFLVFASLVGFAGGQELISMLTDTQNAWLEGFVAGSLLHVVQGHSLGTSHAHNHSHSHSHAVHDQAGEAAIPTAHLSDEAQSTSSSATAVDQASTDCCDDHQHVMTRATILSALGSLCGLALVTVVLIEPHHHHGPFGPEAEALAPAFVDTFIDLALTSAPALLLGYLLAGLVRSFMSARQIGWLTGGSRSTQALKGVAFGLPLPICSCGVLPLYQSLIRAGVPTTAGVAFLIATPELGIDALLLSLPLLGESLTLLRLFAALFVALAVALVLSAFARPAPAAEQLEPPVERAPLSARLRSGLTFGFVELFDHTMPWIVLGLIIAALLAPLLDASTLATLPSALQVPLFALLSVPAYVCAAGATPIAAVAIQSGISPGAALAFLIAGPATNVTTFGILTQLHGRRFALTFGVAVTACAIAAGWLVDLSGLVQPDRSPLAHEHDASAVEELALVLLGVCAAASLFRQGPRGMLQQITAPFRPAGA